MAVPNLFTGSEAFTRREYLTAHMPVLEVPDDFKHTPPSSAPTPPAFPGTLSAPEQAEVEAWLDGLVTPTLAAAITWVSDYETYNNAMDAYKIANQTARSTQWRILYGDALIKNKATTSQSADTGGTGSTPPPTSVYPREDP